MQIGIFIWSILFACATSVAQTSSDFPEMLKDASKVLYNQPDQTLKIVDHVIKNSEVSNEIIHAYLLKARSSYVSGNLNFSIQSALEAKKIAEETEDYEMQLKISMFGIHLLNLLGLDLAAEKYLEFTEIIIGKNEVSHKDAYHNAGQSVIRANKNIDSEQYSEAIFNFSKAKEVFQEISHSNAEIVETEVSLLENYPKAFPVDSALSYLESFQISLDKGDTNNFLKMITFNQLGEVYFLKNQYPKAKLAFDEAFLISEQLSNSTYRWRIAENSAINSLAMEDSENFFTLKKIGAELSKAVERDEENAVNSVFNYTNANHTSKRDLVRNSYRRNHAIFGGVLALFLITWFGLKVRYRSRIKQYQDFIKYFENRQKTDRSSDASINDLTKKEVSKSLNIPKETEEILIQKLDKFENSIQFTKKDMSLAQLASLFDTNTKYLSEIINTHKDKNFNSYINELRINYIIDKLKENRTYLQYKISYLAEESGFSSHSSFATVFKSVTGISPTVFIDILKSQMPVSENHKVYEHAD